MNQLSPEARRLFQLARDGDQPPAHLLQRAESNLAARIARGAALAAVSTVATKAAATATATLPWVKIATSVSIALAASGAGWLGARALESKPFADPPTAVAKVEHSIVSKPVARNSTLKGHSAVSVSPSASATVRNTESMPVEHAVAASSDPPKVAAKRASATSGLRSASEAPSTPPNEDPLDAEVRALREAQQALRVGKGARVLTLLQEQELAFASGTLREERAAAKVLALCQVGRARDARREAERFERSWPKSSLLARLRNYCWSP